MCLGCAVYINNKNYENDSQEQNAQDYNNQTYGE